MILVLITKIARLSGSGKCYIVQLFVSTDAKKRREQKQMEKELQRLHLIAEKKAEQK